MTRFNLTFGWDDFGTCTYSSAWQLDTRRIINCIKFDLVNEGKYRNKVKVSLYNNGAWNEAEEYNVGVSGCQVVAFLRKEVQFVKLILTRNSGCAALKSDVSNVHAALM